MSLLRLLLCCRHFAWFRGRCPFREAPAGIGPCCLRPAPQSTAFHFLFCCWQPAVRGEWHIRPPCDPPWGRHNPPPWSPDIQAGAATHACCYNMHERIAASIQVALSSLLYAINALVRGRTAVHQSCFHAGSTGHAVCIRLGDDAMHISLMSISNE